LIAFDWYNHWLSWPLKLFALLGAYLKPFLCVYAVSSLLVDHQTFVLQKSVEKQITISDLFCRKFLQPLAQRIIMTNFGLLTPVGTLFVHSSCVLSSCG